MKITISKHVAMGDLQNANTIRKEYSNSGNGYFTTDEMNRAAALYLGENSAKAYDVKCEISYHNTHGLSEEMTTNGMYLDVYVEMFARGSNMCGDIGFYLSDFWSSDGENGNYLRNTAYRNLFKKVE